MLTGSSNMDNVSFFYSSELSMTLHDPSIARTCRKRLFKEHLTLHGSIVRDNRDQDDSFLIESLSTVIDLDNFNSCFEGFKQVYPNLYFHLLKFLL